MRTHRRLLATAAAALLLLASACGSDEAGAGGDGGAAISIVGFAVPEAAKTATAGELAKTPEGEGVRFKPSSGASGDQTRAVGNGLKADYGHFSVTGDVTRLVEAGLVDERWDDGPTKGVVS